MCVDEGEIKSLVMILVIQTVHSLSGREVIFVTPKMEDYHFPSRELQRRRLCHSSQLIICDEDEDLHLFDSRNPMVVEDNCCVEQCSSLASSERIDTNSKFVLFLTVILFSTLLHFIQPIVVLCLSHSLHFVRTQSDRDDRLSLSLSLLDLFPLKRRDVHLSTINLSEQTTNSKSFERTSTTDSFSLTV